MEPSTRSAFSQVAVLLFVAVVVAGLMAAPAAAQDILAGLDLFETTSSSTEFDFGPVPLPADFFGPGSDPFDGIVAFVGDPLGSHPACPNDDLSLVSTLVDRLFPAVLPVVPSSDVVPVKIVELSLVSSLPITVTYNGGLNPEQWDVRLDLSVDPQPPGVLAISRTHANGGTFNIALNVLPRFTFTRLAEIRELDFGIAAIPPITLEATGVPWEDKIADPASCTTNWCPGPGPFTLTAPNATHGVRSVCPVANIPTLSTWMALVLVLLLVVAGVVLMRRRALATGTRGLRTRGLRTRG